MKCVKVLTSKFKTMKQDDKMLIQEVHEVIID